MNDRPPSTTSSPSAAPPGRRPFYYTCQTVVALAVTLIYRFRVFGRHHITDAPLLLVSNHQSHLDPPLIGIAVRRRPVLFLARSGLFKFPLFAAIIRGLGAVSLKEDDSDAAAIKKAISLLGEGHIVGIFPEGSRSPDGTIHEFKRGAWLLMSRAKCDVLPVAVEGPFAAWPRSQKIPSLLGHRVAVKIGAPIPFAELKAMGPDKGLAFLRTRVDELRLDLAAMLERHGR